MVHSDRVTSSSDDIGGHVIASSPAASGRHGDPAHGDDADGSCSVASRDENRALSDSLATVFAHSQAQTPVSSVCNVMSMSMSMWSLRFEEFA